MTESIQLTLGAKALIMSELHVKMPCFAPLSSPKMFNIYEDDNCDEVESYAKEDGDENQNEVNIKQPSPHFNGRQAFSSQWEPLNDKENDIYFHTIEEITNTMAGKGNPQSSMPWLSGFRRSLIRRCKLQVTMR